MIGVIFRKALALFGYLAVQDGPVARSQFSSLLWGNLAADRARANLSWTLHYLTSLLPDDTLDATRHCVEVRHNSQTWLDIVAFRTLAVQDDQESLAQATSLYRGVFLDRIEVHGAEEFDLWLLAEREHWRLIDTLYRLAHLYEQKCQLGAARETGNRC